MSGRDIVIIGAPRSGTNMLRDVLTTRQGVVTWPCDELNAMWRHGSRDVPTDEIPADRADKAMRRFVDERFTTMRRRQHGNTAVEKTCANSLRVGYVSALRPHARYVLITRDGVDASASAAARWDATMDWRYTARKARFVPPTDLAHSAYRFARNRVTRWPGSGVDHHTWGPRFAGIDEMTVTHTVEEICAAQWQRCVELSRRALQELPPEQVYSLSYEDFVQHPEPELRSLLGFLELSSEDVRSSVSAVTAKSVGLGRTTLGADQLARVERIVSPTLESLGYV